MKIAFLDDWTSSAAQYVEAHPLATSHEMKIFHDHVTGDALIERLKPFDIICIMRERTVLDAPLLAQLPHLKAVITSGMRNAAIDLEACKAAGISVSGTPSPGHATAELAMSLIGAMARNIVTNHNDMKAGRWQSVAGRDLRDATLGILGLGRLGSVLAELSKAYGMNVVAWSQNLTQEAAAEKGVTYLSQEAFFAQSDFISIHLKLSNRVRGLVGEAAFKQMKPSAYIVNTSRAQIIDETALIKALQDDQIAGAAIDVYEKEPLPAEHPLRSVPNLILSPHIGYVTEETMAIFYEETLAAIEAFMAGKPIRLLT